MIPNAFSMKHNQVTKLLPYEQVSFERPTITLVLTVHYSVTMEELINKTIRQLQCEPVHQADFVKLMDEVESTSYYDTSFDLGDSTLTPAANYFLLKINGCLE